MIHYSCDRCKRSIDPTEELRYVVKVEVQAVLDPVAVDENEDDRDHLLEIQEILEHVDDADDFNVGPDVYQLRQYDLCTDCFRKFKRNPLGSDLAATIGFSQN